MDPGEGPRYFQTKLGPEGPKKVWDRNPPPPHPRHYLRVWITGPSLIWRFGSATDSRSKSLPCWRAREALGEDKQRKMKGTDYHCQKWCELFVFLVPVRLLLSSTAVLLTTSCKRPINKSSNAGVEGTILQHYFICMHVRASTYQYRVQIAILIFDYATRPRVKFKTAMLESDLLLIIGI